MSKLDLDVELYDFIPHGKLQRGRMRLIFTGKDANTQFINSIGRVMMDRLPTYAFARKLIKVERIDPETGYRDSVAVNHDMITLGLSNIPVQGIDPGFAYLHEKYWKDVDYLNDDREKHESEKRIEMFLNVRNTSEELGEESYLPVTTNDMQIYIEDELVEIFDPDYPYLLLKLKPKEQIKLSARAVLGIGLQEACWQAASNYAIDQETEEGSVILMFKSASRFDEYILMERALEYFEERVGLISNMMQKMYLQEEEKKDRFVAVINGEDYTLAIPLAYELQSHPKALHASGTMPDNLIEDQAVISITVDNPSDMMKVIKDSFGNFIAKIQRVRKQFTQIKDKTYSKYLNKNGNSLFYDQQDEIFDEDPTKSSAKSSSAKSKKSAKTKKKPVKKRSK